MNIEIAVVGPDSSGAAFRTAHGLQRCLTAELDPDIDPDTTDAFHASLGGTTKFQRLVMVASLDGDAVGMVRVWPDHMDTNADKAEASIGVHPAHRRKRVGTALLGAVLDVCDNHQRTSLLGAGANTSESDGFWTSFGAELRLLERESRLWLVDSDEETMRSWMDGRATRAADYELRHWRGETPDDMLTNMATLGTAMNDAPRDDLDWADDAWTEQDVIDADQYRAEAGFSRWVSVVIAPDGSPAGYTSVSTNLNKPRFANQGDTVVLRAHRERGIGRWLKADMWLRLRSEAPFVDAIDTGNAQSNDPMLAINVAMGFKPLFVHGFWQADVSALREQLTAKQ